MNKVLKYILESICLTLLFCACGSKKENNQDMTYVEAYDQVVMRIPIDSVARLSGIETKDIIGIRFGIINEDAKLTSRMIEILQSLEDNDQSNLKKLGKSKLELSLKKNGSGIEENDLKAIYASRNKEFGQALPEILSSFLNDKLDDYIENKYDIFNAVPNTWNYYTKSDEEFTKDFLNDFEVSGLQRQSDEFYISTLNNYKNNLSEEIRTLINSEIKIPDFYVIPGDESIENNSIIEDLIIQRTKSQIKEVSSDIFWDFIGALIIGVILSYFMNSAIDDAGKKAVDKFIKRVRWKKGDGLGSNLMRFGLTALGSYGEYENDVKAIKSKYKRYGYLADILVFIVVWGFSWYFIIKPQLHIENQLNEELSAELMNSSNTLQINPERVLNLYLNINDEEINNTNEAINETINSVEEVESPEEVVTAIAVSPDENESVAYSRPITLFGKISNSPIVLELVINEKEITGKYAYKITLKKYGDKPESYFYLSGKLDEYGNMNLVSKMHNKDNPFEYITLPAKELHHGSVISGELINANSGHSHVIELQVE